MFEMALSVTVAPKLFFVYPEFICNAFPFAKLWLFNKLGSFPFSTYSAFKEKLVDDKSNLPAKAFTVAGKLSTAPAYS